MGRQSQGGRRLQDLLAQAFAGPYIYVMPLTGLSLFAIAIAVMLSAFIRLVQTMQLRQRVGYGQVGVRELAELSGVTDPRDLQDVFGPPGMNRIWGHLNLAMIEDKRQLAGYLMSDSRLHWFSMATGLLAFIVGHWSIQIVLIIAALIQSGAWLSATRLPK